MFHFTLENDRQPIPVRRLTSAIGSLKATSTIIFAVLLASCLTPLTAVARTRAETQKWIFELADWNRDGKVTEKEFVITALYAAFAGCAKRDNNKLTKQEYLKAIAGCPEARNAEVEWAMMDVEGRGYITFEDVLRNRIAVEEMQAKFKALDRSGKGFITLADLPRLS
jgi:Ca2+-binding EF-hand superfamily protein